MTMPPLPLACLLLGGLVGAVPAAAQTEVAYPALGLRFEVPPGWQGQEGDGAYLVSHPEVAGLVALLPHQATSLAELQRGAREGLDVSEGSSLQARGAVEAFGRDGVRVDMAGIVEWSPVEAHAIGRLAPQGRGVVVVALAPRGQFTDAYRGYAETVARSVVFSAPEVPPAVQAWADGLRGVELRRYDTRSSSDGGSSSRETLAFCGGAFRYTTSTSGYGTNLDGSGMSAAGRGAHVGTWTVEADDAGQPVLRLAYRDGSAETYTLDEDEGALFLDGERVLRTDAVCD